ncbi:hypothetical protein [Burkholderia diffusa]|uniref:hypothetical protein n=1 Tax=Burkholderia diffusa TaxID=488732 RepID=UPI00158859B5|nr:hypothetical protein [Burkholderia diffusa]
MDTSRRMLVVFYSRSETTAAVERRLTPVWAGRASTPVSTWLARHGSELRATAFFCTMGLRGDLTAFGQMQALARKRPIATRAISRCDIGRGLAARKLARFARSIDRRLAARERHSSAERAT